MRKMWVRLELARTSLRTSKPSENLPIRGFDVNDEVLSPKISPLNIKNRDIQVKPWLFPTAVTVERSF
jgi:hypothetical protein